MKKNSFIVLLVLFLIFGFNLDVKASGIGKPGDDNYAVFQQEFEDGPKNITISSPSGEIVQVYGRSECDPSTNKCTYAYYTYGIEVDTYFRNHIKCSGGQTKIGYKEEQVASDAAPYKGDYKDTEPLEEKLTVYWEEEYTLVCLDNEDVNDDYNQVILGNTSSENNYPSSGGSVENEQTGIATYYVVLIVIALASYGVMLISKKFNLFKNI